MRGEAVARSANFPCMGEQNMIDSSDQRWVLQVACHVGRIFTAGNRISQLREDGTIVRWVTELKRGSAALVPHDPVSRS
jgi:hypothetical protein